MDAKLSEIALHFVGNKTIDHLLKLSEDILTIDDELAELITNAFFERFSKSFEEYEFTHTSSVDFNEVYTFVKDIFENNENLQSNSQKIAQELYQKTNHPNIKDGELYVGLFSN